VAVHAVSARTAVAGVIGRPIRHSRSPAIFNAAFAACGLDWVYLAFDVGEREVPDALVGMQALGIRGLSVTMPAKEAVARTVDRLDPDAAALGAVNCVSLENGVLVGHNTDGAGFVDAVRADLGLELRGTSVAVLGAGGAARAVIRAMAGAGADRVVVVGRTPARVDVATALAGSVAVAGTEADLGTVDVVVNATPVGMAGDTGLPFDPAVLRAGQVVVDLIYHPLETPLLVTAARRGARTANGLGMLVHQAGHQFRYFTGVEPPLAAMGAAALAGIADRG
jgi:shikimate dehydrogenase